MEGLISTAILVLLSVAVLIEVRGVTAQNTLVCATKSSPCYRKVIKCPPECPSAKPSDSKAKACFLDCNSPKCETVCKRRKPNCDGLGAGCYDPRFIGGDGRVFFFNGRKDEHFTLVSDPQNLHVNARFVGLRPAGRARDFTWIQGLGLIFGNDSNTFTVEAAQASKWDDKVDLLRLSYNGKPLLLPQGHLSRWKSDEDDLTVERTASRNSVAIIIEGATQISVNVVPITEEDDRVHKYQIPDNDCFAHLEVQFEFSGLSPRVEGVLGRTYRPDYVSTAKAGVEMPVVGGEDKYWTSSLLATDCKLCSFSPDSPGSGIGHRRLGQASEHDFRGPRGDYQQTRPACLQ